MEKLLDKSISQTDELAKIAEEAITERDRLREANASMLRGLRNATDEVIRLREINKELVDKLRGMVMLYVELANSGDAGFWNPEENERVIASRSIIAKAEKTT